MIQTKVKHDQRIPKSFTFKLSRVARHFLSTGFVPTQVLQVVTDEITTFTLYSNSPFVRPGPKSKWEEQNLRIHKHSFF